MCDDCDNERVHYCDEDISIDMIENNSVIDVNHIKPTISDIYFTAERIEGFIEDIKPVAPLAQMALVPK